MTISRKIGILVFFGVPAIIGGGVMYALFGNYLSVLGYELVLYLFIGSFISK